MKKIFTLTLVLLAMMFGANAQYLLQEGFNTGALPTGWTTQDSDGDGYTWDATFLFQESGTHSGDGMIASASYINNIGALTPDNWLISPAVTMTTGADLTFWVKGQDASYSSENYSVYVATANTIAAFTATTPVLTGTTTNAWEQKTVNLSSYVGQTIYIAFRHHNTTDMYWLDLDDVEIFAQPTTPTIVVNPSTFDFGQVAVGSTQTHNVDVVTYNLTSAVTATTTAPFSVSADGTTYGTTASIAATGGTLYVQYAPTATGANNGTVTLASTGATSVTISLAGEGIDCSNNPLPYSYSFTSDAANQCWEVINANNDDYTFEFNTTDGYASIRYNSTLAMDDWLVSPAFTLNGTQMGSFDYRSGSASWFEKFQVFAFGANDTVTLTPVVEAHNTTYQAQYLDLSNLNGSYKIAIHGVSDADQLRLYIANFAIFSATTNITVNPATIDFGVLPTGATANSSFDATILNATSNITVTTAAPFTVSLDNSTFATSVTIPTPTGTVANQTIYVAYNPTTTGNHNGTVTLSTTGATETVTVTGTGIECNAITTFPFTESFLSTSTTLPCWQIVDNNNDGNTFTINDEAGQVIYAYSSVEDADDYLISPEMTITNNLYGHVDYACASSSYPEKFSIYVIPANGTLANAVNIVPTVDVTNTSWATQNFDLSAYANQTIRIALKAESDADMYLLGFTNFVVEAMPAASITVDPTSMSFSSIVGVTSDAQTANVTAYALTNDITVSTAAPFEVSANGTSFGTTATIPAASIVNHVIYVRYAPTAAGSQNGTVTLTSGSLSATINVSGFGLDCSAPINLPFNEDFEDEGTLECWIFVDADGDGYLWDPSYLRDLQDEDTGEGYGHNGSYGMVASSSWLSSTGALTPDNWLITPEIIIPANYNSVTLSWFAKGQDPSYAAEHYAVLVSTTGANTNNFSTTLYEGEANGDWEQHTANLTSYAGQNIRLAFRHYNVTDMFWLDLDDISITGTVGVNEFENNVTIYPNPANNVLNINANSNINRVDIFNTMGQMVGSFDANDLNTQINTTHFANGVYTVKIETENGTSTQKFTVIR